MMALSAADDCVDCEWEHIVVVVVDTHTNWYMTGCRGFRKIANELKVHA